MTSTITNAKRGERGAGRGGDLSRPAMSLLEVVLAVALLGMIVAAITATFGFATMSQLRERQRLAAVEVAHRLLLSYLDDPTEMPDSARPVEYGPPEAPARFRWDFRENQIFLHEVAADRRDPTRQSPLSMERFQIITIRVWLSEESGGSRQPEPGTPMAVLSRMIDPIAVRNPDSTLHMLGTERGRQRWMEAMTGIAGTGTGIPTGGQRGREGGSQLRMHQGGARDAFQRGTGGMGGQRIPKSELRQHMSPLGGSWDDGTFFGGRRRER